MNPGGAGRPPERFLKTCRRNVRALRVLREKGLVVVAQNLDQVGCEPRVVEAERAELGRPRTDAIGRAQRDDRRRQLLTDLVQHVRLLGAGPIDLIDEQHRGNGQTLQGTHEHPRLSLHSLNRRDEEHGAVERAEYPLDLGDEVGMAGRIDEVDRRLADGEIHDGRLNRDPSLAFQREEIGLRAAVVDAAGPVDHTGGIGGAAR